MNIYNTQAHNMSTPLFKRFSFMDIPEICDSPHLEISEFQKAYP